MGHGAIVRSVYGVPFVTKKQRRDRLLRLRWMALLLLLSTDITAYSKEFEDILNS
jgi:hypothetical protein